MEQMDTNLIQLKNSDAAFIDTKFVGGCSNWDFSLKCPKCEDNYVQLVRCTQDNMEASLQFECGACHNQFRIRIDCYKGRTGLVTCEVPENQYIMTELRASDILYKNSL